MIFLPSRRELRLQCDDVSLTSLLYDGKAVTGTPVSVYRAADEHVDRIETDLAANRRRAALGRMKRLLESDAPVSQRARLNFTIAIAELVPPVPAPVIARGGASAGAVLELLFERFARDGETELHARVGTILYRFHEGRGSYVRARAVIGRLLNIARKNRDAAQVAVLVNNYGYEHLLAGEWEMAEPWFRAALTLFTRQNALDELSNAHANLLQCRFALQARDRRQELIPRLKATNRDLMRRRDWRARKTLMLLARCAEARGRLAAASGWARRALAVSRGVATRHRDEDRAYLSALRESRGDE